MTSADCCHMGTAIKHPVLDRVKSLIVILDVKNYKWWLYSCTHMATVGVQGLNKAFQTSVMETKAQNLRMQVTTLLIMLSVASNCTTGRASVNCGVAMSTAVVTGAERRRPARRRPAGRCSEERRQSWWRESVSHPSHSCSGRAVVYPHIWPRNQPTATMTTSGFSAQYEQFTVTASTF